MALSAVESNSSKKSYSKAFEIFRDGNTDSAVAIVARPGFKVQLRRIIFDDPGDRDAGAAVTTVTLGTSGVNASGNAGGGDGDLDFTAVFEGISSMVSGPEVLGAFTTYIDFHIFTPVDVAAFKPQEYKFGNGYMKALTVSGNSSTANCIALKIAAEGGANATYGEFKGMIDWTEEPITP